MTTSASPSAPVSPPRLSAALRERTEVVHAQAESAGFVRQLLAGALPLPAYTALVAQNHAVYTALETAAERWRGHPVAGPFVVDELTRVPRLEADLAHLLGAGWPEAARRLLVPATTAYVERLQAVAGTWAGGFVAHHYVRYLGDLSGGQIIAANIARIYGEPGRRATAFYAFDEIPKIKPFRDRYRALLDGLPFAGADQDRVVAEAVAAFTLNHAVFTDLGRTHLAATGASIPDQSGR